MVIPGLPHHVPQRGNRRQQIFFNDGDYAAYLELMAERCGKGYGAAACNVEPSLSGAKDTAAASWWCEVYSHCDRVAVAFE